jgi:transposase
MGKHQRQYTREYKQEAVGLMETSGKPVAVIARELGINANLLYRWRQ